MLRTHRTLRIEPLDRRNLLAVTPVGLLMADAPPPGGESTLVADALTVPYTEGRVPHTEERSFDEINTPELINGPANGFNPGEFEQFRPVGTGFHVFPHILGEQLPRVPPRFLDPA